jgi:hypothetical protein
MCAAWCDRGEGGPLNPNTVTIEQVGSNVVATGSGEFGLTGFNLFCLRFRAQEAMFFHLSAL